MCLKIGQLACGHMSLFNYFCVFKIKNSLDYSQSLKFLPLRQWHVAHHGTFSDHLKRVFFNLKKQLYDDTWQSNPPF